MKRLAEPFCIGRMAHASFDAPYFKCDQRTFWRRHDHVRRLLYRRLKGQIERFAALHRKSQMSLAKQVSSGINELLFASAGVMLVRRPPAGDSVRPLLATLGHFNVRRVIDVGANAGQFAGALFEAGYDGDIFSVEPLPDAHARLCARAAANPRWKVLPACAAGSSEGQVELHVAANSYSSSVLPMLQRHVDAAPQSTVIERIGVTQRTLDSLFPDAEDDRSALLLKVDAQGYELEVLRGAVFLLRRAVLVELELSLQRLYSQQPLWLEVIDFMASIGFDLWNLEPEFRDPQTYQLLQLNALFFRPAEPTPT